MSTSFAELLEQCACHFVITLLERDADKACDVAGKFDGAPYGGLRQASVRNEREDHAELKDNDLARARYFFSSGAPAWLPSSSGREEHAREADFAMITEISLEFSMMVSPAGGRFCRTIGSRSKRCRSSSRASLRHRQPIELDDRNVANSQEKAFVRDLVTEGAKQDEEILAALDAFVLSGAMKLHREAHGRGAGFFRHHTMLVHESVTNVGHAAGLTAQSTETIDS